MSNELKRYPDSVTDVADHFEVHVNTVYNWVKTTDIPHRRLGRVIRFNLTEVDAWAEANTSDVAATAAIR